jgi:ABC-2 type transport system ATP-binding protein
MPSSKPILIVDSLVKIFEPRGFFIRKSPQPSFTAIDHISFTIEPGEIVGLLGPNGSGKTTTMQMLLGTLTPTDGRIEYFGKDFATHRSEILQEIGFASSYLKLAPRLTIWENLDVFGRLYGLDHKERADAIEKFLKFFDMWKIRSKEVGVLSAGQTTRVMLTKAFLARPKLVLLDEPTASLDPDIAFDIRQFIIKQRQENGLSILIASHNMDEVSQLCDRVLVLKNGKIIASDTPAALAARISTARVRLTIQDGLEHAISYANQHHLPYVATNTGIAIEIDEQKVATLLIDLARAHITYTNIAIEKPTLEDYFLYIAHTSTPNSKPKGML